MKETKSLQLCRIMFWAKQSDIFPQCLQNTKKYNPDYIGLYWKEEAQLNYTKTTNTFIFFLYTCHFVFVSYKLTP